MTCSCWLHRTKSTTLRSKRFLFAHPFAVTSAENATWASTVHSGKAVCSRRYICCSRAVITGFLGSFNGLRDLAAWRVASMAKNRIKAAMAIRTVWEGISWHQYGRVLMVRE
ncbi:hypothetical protein D3C72_878560 [compost metagenome]